MELVDTCFMIVKAKVQDVSIETYGFTNECQLCDEFTANFFSDINCVSQIKGRQSHR